MPPTGVPCRWHGFFIGLFCWCDERKVKYFQRRLFSAILKAAQNRKRIMLSNTNLPWTLRMWRWSSGPWTQRNNRRSLSISKAINFAVRIHGSWSCNEFALPFWRLSSLCCHLEISVLRHLVTWFDFTLHFYRTPQWQTTTHWKISSSNNGTIQLSQKLSSTLQIQIRLVRLVSSLTNKSPEYDPAWNTNGLLLQAANLMLDWVKA